MYSDVVTFEALAGADVYGGEPAHMRYLELADSLAERYGLPIAERPFD